MSIHPLAEKIDETISRCEHKRGHIESINQEVRKWLSDQVPLLTNFGRDEEAIRRVRDALCLDPQRKEWCCQELHHFQETLRGHLSDDYRYCPYCGAKRP